MDLLLDAKIDEELKQKFYDVTLATYPDKEKLKQDPDGLLALENIVTIIGLNSDISFFKMRNLLHIVLYNYIEVKCGLDDCLEDWDFTELVENSLSSLLKTIRHNDNLEYYLIYKYYQTLVQPHTLELIKENHDLVTHLPWLNTWHQPFTLEGDLITTKLKMVAFSLFEYCDYTCPDLKDTIILDFFRHHKDFFGVTKESFNSAQEFFTYLPILIQMLYIDSYYYLESKKALLSKEQEILNFVRHRIKENKITTLPDDEYLILQILQCSSFINMDKEDFFRHHPEKLDKVQKLVKEKANKILLFEYC